MNQEPLNKAQSSENISVHPHHKKAKKLKSRLAWTILFVAIAAVTLWTIFSQDSFSISEFGAFLKGMKPWWLIAAFASMLGFILFEGLALLVIIRSFGYKKSLGHGAIYASGDIYFSAITPSATGGQPACAYFMMKDKIPGTVVTVALIANLIMYTFAILIIGIVSILMRPTIFFGLAVYSQILILIGALALIGLAIGFMLILFKGQFLHKLGNGLINILAKLKLIRKPEKKKERLSAAIVSYTDNVEHLVGKRKMLLQVLLCNVLQRACGIAVTLFVFLGSNGAASNAVDVWVSQCLVVLGSNTMPIPGAMGISDLLLHDAVVALGHSDVYATNLNLLSRTISFYSCVILCGLAMVVRIISYKVIEKRQCKRELQ